MPHTRAAGVREASREETAGRVRSVVRRAMGIVTLPVVARWAGASELGRDEVVADGDEVARRTTLREHPYRTDTQERGPRRRGGESARPRSMTGGESGLPLGVVL